VVLYDFWPGRLFVARWLLRRRVFFFFFFFFFATCSGAHIARHVQAPPIAEIEPMHEIVLCACFSAAESDARALTGRLTSLRRVTHAKVRAKWWCAFLQHTRTFSHQ
jgi:hypothetical protein